MMFPYVSVNGADIEDCLDVVADGDEVLVELQICEPIATRNNVIHCLRRGIDPYIT
ncbi:hypothetical protein DPMN_046442 [Dreissena polymorpha]|uniref:Uncharacterized protein n=1 Tax=Dreissena polymorpha TaxID=45954 RepID=A0A9D4D6T9_DREPO|nr:hypothetical protein DPMN_046442 [Dreissena polymorpha]